MSGLTPDNATEHQADSRILTVCIFLKKLAIRQHSTINSNSSNRSLGGSNADSEALDRLSTGDARSRFPSPQCASPSLS